jgi:hypothetical protein
MATAMAKLKRYEELEKKKKELEEENVNDEEYDEDDEDEEDEFEGLNEEEEQAEAKGKKERQIETIQKALLTEEKSRGHGQSAAAEYNGNKHRQMFKMTVGKKMEASTALRPYMVQSDEEEDDEKEVENHPIPVAIAPAPLYKTIMVSVQKQTGISRDLN